MEEEELLSSVHNLKNISRNNSMFFEDIFFQKKQNNSVVYSISFSRNYAVSTNMKHAYKESARREIEKIRPRTEEP